MKKTIIFSLTALLLSAIIFLSWDNKNNNHTKKLPAYQGSADDQPIIAIRKLKLKSGASAQEFEKFAEKIAHKEFGTLPGVNPDFAVEIFKTN